MTRTLKAIVDVDLAQHAHSSWRTGAAEAIHQIVACSTIVTWLGGAFVNVIFTICALESQRAFTGVVALQVVTRCTVPAWHWRALIYLSLTVTAIKSWRTNTQMGVADILAWSAIVTKVGDADSFLCSSHWAANHADITQAASPARATRTAELVGDLYTRTTILTWRLVTPINKVLKSNKLQVVIFQKHN